MLTRPIMHTRIGILYGTVCPECRTTMLEQHKAGCTTHTLDMNPGRMDPYWMRQRQRGFELARARADAKARQA